MRRALSVSSANAVPVPLHVAVVAAAVVVVLGAGTTRAQPIAPTAGPTTHATSDAAAAAVVDDEFARLRADEAQLSSGSPLAPDEVQVVIAILRGSPQPRARALAAAVLPWLEAAVAAPALIAALHDDTNDASTRAQCLAGLLALARRLPEELRTAAADAARAAVDDPRDEVACAGLELALALDPTRASTAPANIRPDASPTRRFCVARAAGGPEPVVDIPPLPPDAPVVDDGAPAASPSSSDAGSSDAASSEAATAPSSPSSTSSVAAASPPSTLDWPRLVVGASAGLLVGGVLPFVVVPPRDVFVYTSTRTRSFRQELSFGTQMASAVVGGAVFAATVGGADALWGRLPDDQRAEAGVDAALVTGASSLLGAGLSFALAWQGGAQAAALSSTTTLGFVGGELLARFAPADANDRALALALGAGGALAGGLSAFAAVPVNVDEVWGSPRTDFGFGMAAVGAGAFTLAGMALAPVVDAAPVRSGAALAGGLLGAGLGLGATYLVTPESLDVRSRVACGVGLGLGLVGAATAALLVDEPPARDDRVDGPARGHADAGPALSWGFAPPTVVVLADGRSAWWMPLAGGRF